MTQWIRIWFQQVTWTSMDFENSKNVQNLVNFMFRNGIILSINKITWVTTNTVTAIDHIKTNVIIDINFETEILNSCNSDHFVIMLTFQIGEKKCVTNQNNKIIFNDISIESFWLCETKWDNVKTSNNFNLADNEFLNAFTSPYDGCFLMMKKKVKARNRFRP